MAVNPKTRFTWSVKDFSKEVGSLSVMIDDAALSAYDVDGVINPQSGDPAYDFIGALTAVTVGSEQSYQFTAERKVSSAPSANTVSRREKKWIVFYEDTVTFAAYNFEIPCARDDSAMAFNSNSDEVNLGVAPWTTFVTAAEAFVRSPDGNPINIIAVQAVGRNL